MPTYVLDNFRLTSGQVRRHTVVSYRTYGTLSSNRDNAIVFPTPFGARSDELDWVGSADGLFDTSRYFLVVVDTFGNGLSTSPLMTDANQSSNEEACQPMALADSVNAQRRLLKELFDVETIAMAAGWSIGGQQAYQWASAYPSAVERLCVICGSAKTAPHNFVFLDGVRSALETALQVSGDQAETTALRVVGRIYAGWALSQSFYRNELWKPLGYYDLEDFLTRYWEGTFIKRRAANILAQIVAWQRFDISHDERFAGDLVRALRSIEAKVLLIPCEQDLYFRLEDSEIEAQHLTDVRLRPIRSDWGHRAGLPAQNLETRTYIRQEIASFLE